VHGLGAALRQVLMFAKPWQRVLLGVAIAVGGALLESYVLSGLGVVIVGFVILGALRRRREAGVVQTGTATGTDSEADVDEP
jgi:hypothetical protein